VIRKTRKDKKIHVSLHGAQNFESVICVCVCACFKFERVCVCTRVVSVHTCVRMCVHVCESMYLFVCALCVCVYITHMRPHVSPSCGCKKNLDVSG